MFDTADVLVNRTPVVVNFFSKRQFVVFRIGITQVVPRGAQEGVHGIGFTSCRATAFGAGAIQESFGSSKRRFSACIEFNIFRQANGEFFFRNKNFAASRAVNYRNGSAPITLTANQPVTQTIVYTAFTEAFSFSFVHDCSHCSVHFHTVEFTGVNQFAFFFFVSAGHFFQFQINAFRLYNNDFFDAVFFCKHPVTLVTGRYAHNCASTIIVQNVVGYPNFNGFTSVRVNAMYASEDTFFFGFTGSTFNIRLVANFFAECFNFSSFGIVFADFFNQRMFSSQSHEGYAIRSIRTSGVNCNFIVECRNSEFHFQTFTATNPVALHGFNAFRPAFQQVQIFQQFISIVSDFEEPLFQIFLFNYAVATPAFTIDNLFVSKYGVTFVAPVNCRFFLSSQTFFIEQFKEPLGPFVVIFFAGCNFTIPVICQAQSFQLTSHVSNVFKSPVFRSYAMFNSSVFCRHTKGVPTHGVKNIEAFHGAETRKYVANGVVANVTHMQITGRIREHFQYIGLGFVFVHFYFKGFVFVPIFLPFFFYGMGSIFFIKHL